MQSPHIARLGDRSLFPRLSWEVYASHAAISPPSVVVEEAAAELLADYAARGAGAFGPWVARREALRGELAELIGAQPDDLAFLTNTTHGVVAIAVSYPWRAGDRVLLFDSEFPTNVTPWLQAARDKDLRPRLVPGPSAAEPQGRFLARVEEELRRGVRLCAISEVAFQTGLRAPVRELAALCHAYDAELFVDAIQSVGCVPVDVAESGVDYLAAGSHKWLMGMEGGGLLYVRPERVGALRPVMCGWLSHEEGLRFLFEGAGHLKQDRPIRRRAAMIEGGVANALGLAALAASVGLLRGLGVEAIFEHVSGWLDRLEAGLVERGFTSLRAAEAGRRSGILSVRPPVGVDVVALHEALSRRGVCATIPDGLLRFAPHWPNHVDEVPRVLAALDEATAAVARATEGS